MGRRTTNRHRPTTAPIATNCEIARSCRPRPRRAYHETMASRIEQQIRRLSPEELTYLFGEQTLERGRTLARTGHVGKVEEDEGTLRSSVMGTGTTYTQHLTKIDPLTGYCSCPVHFSCKHIAAVLVSLGAGAQQSAWRTILETIAPRDDATDAENLGLLLDRGGSSFVFKPLHEVAGRPAGRKEDRRHRHTRSAHHRDRGWTPHGIGWQDIMHSSRNRLATRFYPAQLEAMRSFYQATAHVEGFQTVQAIDVETAGPSLYTELNRLAGAGVRLFFDDPSTPLVLSRLPWDIQANIRIQRSGDLAVLFVPEAPNGSRAEALPGTDPLLAVGLLPDGTDLNAFGVDGTTLPATEPSATEASGFGRGGVVESHQAKAFVLGRVNASVPAEVIRMAGAHDSFEVPAAEQLEFEASFLPALGGAVKVDSSDRTFTPHRVGPARLHLSVTREGDGLTLTWREAREMEGQEKPILTPLLAVSHVSDDVAAARHAWKRARMGVPLSFAIPTGLDLSLYGKLRTEFLPALEKAGIGVDFAADADIDVLTAAPVITTIATDNHDWLDLEVVVEVEGRQIALSDLYRALMEGKDFVTVGEVAVHLGPQFDKLRQLLKDAAALGEVKADSISVPTLRAHALELENLQASAELRAKLHELDSLGEELAEPEHFDGKLRPYQVTGYSWLTHLARAQFGGLLADDMGLGKTVQLLAMIQHLKEADQLDAPVLIVAPTSVISTWKSEAERFTPKLRVATISGTSKKRNRSISNLAERTDIIVTSYTLVRLDAREYRTVKWGGIVADEAQNIKNPSTVGYRAISELERPWTFAVTGTPVENSLDDLAALLYLTSPGLLPTHAGFAEKFRNPIERSGDKSAADLLTRLIHPFMMRRRKSEVARELPEKMESVVSIELAPQHARRYREQLERERQEVLGLLDNVSKNRISILASLTRLRRLAIDPALITTDDERAALTVDVPSAEKTDFLVDSLEQLLPAGHQVLVFSQFTTYLHRIEVELHRRGIGFAYLDGSTRDRDHQIAQFKSGDKPVFLISLKAGGVGLTLTEADYVYIMDPWWNPAAEEQAIDRAHRIGQDKPVNVYRLVSEGTIEEKVIKLQEKKRALAGIVDAGAGVPITGADLRDLFK